MRSLLIMLLLFSASVAADDSSVYETITHVSIGRVFLTPDERRRLDAARKQGLPSASMSGTAAGDSNEAETPSNAAGYIVSSNGKARRWLNGDFVEAQNSPTSSTRFPGDVKIVRHIAETIEPDSTDAEAAADE